MLHGPSSPMQTHFRHYHPFDLFTEMEMLCESMDQKDHSTDPTLRMVPTSMSIEPRLNVIRFSKLL